METHILHGAPMNEILLPSLNANHVTERCNWFVRCRKDNGWRAKHTNVTEQYAFSTKASRVAS